MNYEIIPTELFENHLKQISKKYPKIKQDIIELAKSLSENPLQGDSIGKDCYKVRMKITGKPAGKSYGARLITCVKVINQKIYLLSIYDKSDKSDLVWGELNNLLSKNGL